MDITEVHLNSIEEIIGKGDIGIMWQSIQIYDPLVGNQRVEDVRLERDYSDTLTGDSKFLLSFNFGPRNARFKYVIGLGVFFGDIATPRLVLRALWDDHKLRDKLADIELPY